MASEYYSYDDINATNANYRIIIGERSNGKTYGFKKQAFDHWMQTGKQFAYLRRTHEEIETKRVGNYWNDLLTYINEELAKVYPEYEYFNITPYRGEWRVLGIKGSTKDLLGTIGYYFCLVQSAYDKSNSYPDVDTICFEEFLTSGYQIKEEFEIFQNFISTIKRKRTDMVIYMLGNTIDRNSQILAEMGINIRDLVQGEIKRYSYFNSSGEVVNSVAVEYCRNYAQSDESAGFFQFNNQKEDMIVKGGWQVGAYPQFTLDEYYEQSPNFGIVINTPQYKLYCYVISEKENIKLYVSPMRLGNRLQYLTLTHRPTNPQYKMFNYTSDNEVAIKLKNIIFSCLRNNQIYYLDNLTGNDFDHIRKDLFYNM